MKQARCTCARNPELGTTLWICMKRRATCRWHVWLVLRHEQPHTVFLPLCSRLLWGTRKWARKEDDEESPGNFSFSQRAWNTYTLMKQTRAQRSTEPPSVHVRADARRCQRAPQTTCTRRTMHLTKLYANTFSFQSVLLWSERLLFQLVCFLLAS